MKKRMLTRNEEERGHDHGVLGVLSTIQKAEFATQDQLDHLTHIGYLTLKKTIANFGLTKRAAQNCHMHGDIFTSALREATLACLRNLSSEDKFCKEEITSSVKYLAYKNPLDVYLQIKRLREIYPGLGSAMDIFEDPRLGHQFGVGNISGLPFAEGWFAFPNWRKKPQIFGRTYNVALQVAFSRLSSVFQNRFKIAYGVNIGEEYIRQLKATSECMAELIESQEDRDILVIPAQLGMLHRGQSYRRALERIEKNNQECGLGVFAFANILLTHPERLSGEGDLGVDCLGDETCPSGNGTSFNSSPSFRWNNGGVEFLFRNDDIPSPSFGAASGFLPL